MEMFFSDSGLTKPQVARVLGRREDSLLSSGLTKPKQRRKSEEEQRASEGWFYFILFKKEYKHNPMLMLTT
jgi:hypothetical protein